MNPIRRPKLADQVADELKRWITAQGLQPGDRLAKEAELRKIFRVSPATIREALKSLEVQGLISITTGPNGGARVESVPFSAAFQHLQTYLYFTDLNPFHLYAVRALIEPELIAGAIPNLAKADIEALEHSVELCEQVPVDRAHATRQRQEDLAFHSIIARCHPNPLLRFMVEFVSEALRQLSTPTSPTTATANVHYGQANAHAHRGILAAIKARDAVEARALMQRHLGDVEKQVIRMHMHFRQRLVLDSELSTSQVAPRTAARPKTGRRKKKA